MKRLSLYIFERIKDLPNNITGLIVFDIDDTILKVDPNIMKIYKMEPGKPKKELTTEDFAKDPDAEHYHDLRLDKINEWNEMREDSDKRIEERKRIMEQQRIDELKKRGVLCPQCQKGEITKHYHGLCEVYFKSDAGGALGGGSNAPYIDANEYQIHYKKCDKCDYIDIFEYRFVPSWFTDLFNLDRPFHSGSPINDYKPEHYIKYKITRW